MFGIGGLTFMQLLLNFFEPNAFLQMFSDADKNRKYENSFSTFFNVSRSGVDFRSLVSSQHVFAIDRGLVLSSV